MRSTITKYINRPITNHDFKWEFWYSASCTVHIVVICPILTSYRGLCCNCTIYLTHCIANNVCTYGEQIEFLYLNVYRSGVARTFLIKLSTIKIFYKLWNKDEIAAKKIKEVFIYRPDRKTKTWWSTNIQSKVEFSRRMRITRRTITYCAEMFSFVCWK